MIKSIVYFICFLSVCTYSQEKRHLIFAIDGFSKEAFDYLKSQGSFKSFKYQGAHIAPFPSMTEPSWTAITQTEKVFGNRGNVRTIEAKWFDAEQNHLMDDSRKYFLRMAQHSNYMRAFDYYFNPFYEAFMYFPAENMIQKEFTEIEQSVLGDFKGTQFVVYVSSLDAVAHTHRQEILPLLRRIDTLIQRLEHKLGPDLKISLISDHGNVGLQPIDQPDLPLHPVNMEPILLKYGFKLSQTLVNSHDLVMPMMALGSAGYLYMQDLSLRPKLAQNLVKEPSVDHAIWVDSLRQVHVLNSKGYALIMAGADSSLSYKSLYGNPLDIEDSLISTHVLKSFKPQAWFDATSSGVYPDAVLRLWDYAQGRIQQRPDMILTLKDGFYFNGSLGQYVQMYRTHGSLSRSSSLAILASTEDSIPPYVRSAHVLKTLGIQDSLLFSERKYWTNASNALQMALEMKKTGGIPTKMDVLNGDLIYRRIAKVLSQSLEFMSADQIEEIQALIYKLSMDPRIQKTKSKSKIPPSKDLIEAKSQLDEFFAQIQKAQWKNLLNHMDDFFNLKDSLQTLSQDTALAQIAFKSFEKTLLNVHGMEPLKPLFKKLDSLQKLPHQKGPSYAEGMQALRHFVMKMWTVPYLVNEVLNLPESNRMADSRDLDFAHQFLETQKQHSQGIPYTDSMGSKLFEQIFQERQLVHKLAPAPVPVFYDELNPPEDLAFVFVPGIYNELFDQEIFARGLRALQENMNVRVIYADVDGRCGSGTNAKKILERLKLDTKQRLSRGYALPRYILAGYSKGGVDLAQMLLLDTSFSKQQVQALFTIASPNQGTPIIESSDLPKALTVDPILRPIDSACIQDPARHSLQLAERKTFWDQEGYKIPSIVPLVSVSLQSDMKKAHPWMKVAKLLGRFEGPNDGVVPVWSSKFPRTIKSLDLGTLEGDHLSGILASDFPQEAFFESIWLSSLHLGMSWNKRPWLIQAPTTKSTAPMQWTPSPMPVSTLKWTPNKIIDLRKYPQELAHVQVEPIVPQTQGHWHSGIHFDFHHQSVLDYRHAYGFSYESKSPLQMDDQAQGYSAQSEHGLNFIKMKSQNNSIRLTTSHYRFKPWDFPKFSLKLRVNQGVIGADPAKGGSGKDDAAFQIWFTIRDLSKVKDRRLSQEDEQIILFGYYWADPNEKGWMPALGSVVENTYSRKNFWVITLPPTYQIPLGGGSLHKGEWQTYERHLVQDLAQAFPDRKIEDFEILSITLQTDSNDSESSSECDLAGFSFLAQPSVANASP